MSYYGNKQTISNKMCELYKSIKKLYNISTLAIT